MKRDLNKAVHLADAAERALATEVERRRRAEEIAEVERSTRVRAEADVAKAEKELAAILRGDIVGGSLSRKGRVGLVRAFV
jgi:hypothetical protein